MDLDFRHVLVDGSLRSPAVWVGILVSAAFLSLIGVAFVRFLLIRQSPAIVRRLFWLPVLPVLLVALPFANGLAFHFVFLGPTLSSGLCLMPTFHILRDLLPFGLAAGVSIGVGRRRLTKCVAA